MWPDDQRYFFLHENISAPTVQKNYFQKFRQQMEWETIFREKVPNNETQQNTLFFYISIILAMRVFMCSSSHEFSAIKFRAEYRLCILVILISKPPSMLIYSATYYSINYFYFVCTFMLDTIISNCWQKLLIGEKAPLI